MNFYEVTKNYIGGHELMLDREKISMNELVDSFPDGVTIIDFDFFNSTENDDRYVIFIFAENDDTYCLGGKSITELCTEWVKQFDGDITATRTELKNSGGVKIKFENSVCKNGHRFYKISLV